MDTGMLRQAGLTEGESKVYLALLELGPSTSGPIVEKSGVSRSIIYHLLDRLSQKGLVSHITKEKTRYFQAAEPSRIREYLEEEERKFRENRLKMDELLPKLYGLQCSAKESEAKVYMGFKGMITAHERTYQKLSRGEGYYYMGVPAQQEAHFHAYWLQDHARRAKLGIKARMLFHPDTDISVLRSRNRHALCDARYMPNSIDTPAWFMGYKDVAVIGLQAKVPITVEITNQEIADSFKAYFEEFWKRSKQLETEGASEKQQAKAKKKKSGAVFDEDYGASEM
ncbi:MAG: helix-turn-helix domain-containing protein [Candidatus Micrarchaeia archaeon]